MGQTLSLKENIESIPSSKKIIFEDLTQQSLEVIQLVRRKLQRHILFSKSQLTSNYIASLISARPSTLNTLSQVASRTRLKDGIDWKSFIGALALFSSSPPEDVVTFLFSLYELDRSSNISRKQLEVILHKLLTCYTRLLNVSSSSGNVGHINVEHFTQELMTNISQSKPIHSKDLRSTFQRQASLLASQLPHNQIPDRKPDVLQSCHCAPVRVSSTTSVPITRYKHAAAYMKGSVFILGGRSGYTALKDLWMLDTDTEKWCRLEPSGENLPMLEEHAMVAYQNHLYVFGGEFSSSVDTESPLWIYCTAENYLVRHSIDSEVVRPENRRQHTLVAWNGALHMYGGYVDLRGSSGELWTFDIASESWHLCYSDRLTADGPGPRHAHSAVVFNGSMWLFGGMCDLLPRNDLFSWNLGVRRWTRMKTRVDLPALSSHTACMIGSDMLVVGGERSGQLLQDLWKINLDTLQVSKVQFSGTPPGPRAQHSTCVCLSPAPSPHHTPNRSFSKSDEIKPFQNRVHPSRREATVRYSDKSKRGFVGLCGCFSTKKNGSFSEDQRPLMRPLVTPSDDIIFQENYYSNDEVINDIKQLHDDLDGGEYEDDLCKKTKDLIDLEDVPQMARYFTSQQPNEDSVQAIELCTFERSDVLQRKDENSVEARLNESSESFVVPGAVVNSPMHPPMNASRTTLLSSDSAVHADLIVEDLEGSNEQQNSSGSDEENNAEEDISRRHLQKYIQDLDLVVNSLDRAVNVLSSPSHGTTKPTTQASPINADTVRCDSGVGSTRPSTGINTGTGRSLHHASRDPEIETTFISQPKEQQQVDLNLLDRRLTAGPSSRHIVLYILGGKDLEPQSLGRRPLAAWKCDIAKL